MGAPIHDEKTRVVAVLIGKTITGQRRSDELTQGNGELQPLLAEGSNFSHPMPAIEFAEYRVRDQAIAA